MAEFPEALASRACSWLLSDPAATAELGAALARSLPGAAPARWVLYFEGDLGAGKTSLIRALLAGLGHTGRVPSPTYTLVEPYLLERYRVFHADLYRLRDAAELDDLGLADDLGAADEEGRGSLLLVEWPGRGAGRLPHPDLLVRLSIDGTGRRVSLTPCSDAGLSLLIEAQGALPGSF